MRDLVDYLYKVVVCACVIVSTSALVMISLSLEEINQKFKLFDYIDHIWK